ncbi:tudor domain-containing protein 15 [Erpetoichthys calabaricus]|uniref:tudor domain-containing protein 15 n=1 Tax=Erpetoichthys calabaricus TaxID=27687 RepID=UPI00223485DA|nr:tudor domain-containing protein 15 [Erpetoichthys calabaricus]
MVNSWSDTDAVLPFPHSVWSVELKLTHVDCNPNQPLVHFQGQHLLVCELDYNILHSEIQNAQKIQGIAEIGTFCLVEDCFSGQWYRGRVHRRCGKIFDVFLLDYGSILSCDESHIASASDDHLILPPKIVCGFFANILPNGDTWDSTAVKYFSKLIGQEIKGYIQAVLPYKVLILEIPDINKELLQHGSGKTVDRNTFLVIVEMLTELSVKDWKPIPHLLSERNLTQEKNPFQVFFQGLLNIFPYCLPELSIGKKLSVKITAASTLSLFFCQLMNKARDLEVLTQKLKHFCESYIGDFKENSSGISDQLCAVKGKCDMWYRGLIQHVLPNGNIVVFFLDFGYSDIVKSDHILPVERHFFSEPVMAFPCTLTCLEEQDEELLKLQTDKLKEGLLGGIVLACVDRFSVAQSRYYVTLFSLHNSSEKKNQGTLSIDPPITTANMNALPEVSHVFDLSIKRLDDSCFCENMEFKENSIFVGYIEHILHPSHFWMRSDDRNAEFEDMMEEINNLYSGKELEDNILQNLIPGVWCCAMFEKDWTYYRAVIVDIFEQGAEVFFVDFGNTEMVPFMFIKEMPCELSKIPAFAFLCSLAHAVPIEDVWTVKATDVFKKLVMNKVLLVRIVLIQKDKYIVDIHDKENNKISVASALAMAGHAEYWKNTTINVNFKKKQQMESSCHPLQKKKLGSNSGKKTSENLPFREDALKQQTIATSKIPQAQTRFLTKQDGETVLPTQCLSKIKLFIKPLIFKPGMVVDVIVSLVISPFEFWCQLKNQSSQFKLLMGQIQQYYRVNNFVFQPDENVCIAKCTRNGQWHRGFITRNCGSSVDVFFVDLGLTETKPICEIRAIKPEFTYLEGQAFRCSFYSLIEPTVNFPYWNQNACKIFKEMVENSNSLFTCTILGLVSRGNILCCIVDMKNHFFVASQFLIDNGVARKTENLCITSVFFHTYLYCSYNLMIGNEEQVHITHVKSPFELYCQLDRNSQMFEDLMLKVSKVASERQNQSSSDIQWKLCLALYSRDGLWYRGLCHPLPSPLHFNVHFVDYGNMEIIEKKNIIPILAKEKDLIYTPVQAVKCSLLNIPKGELIPEVLAYLEENVLNKTLNAIISGKETDGSIVVELYDGRIQVNKKVKEIIDKNFQQSDSERRQLHKNCNINHRILHSEKNCTSDKIKMKPRKKNQNVSIIWTNILCKAVSECGLMNVMPKKTPELVLECTQKKPHFQKENKYAGVMHINRDCKSTCEKECNTPEYSDLPSRKFNTGWKTDAYISHVNSIFDFFIQLAKDKSSIVNMEKELSDNLNKQKEHFIGHVKMNDLIALESENHETFYRAVVKNVSSNSQLLVELIDYGKGILADKSKLYNIPYNFVKKPRLSIHCCLLKSDLVGSDFPFRVDIPEQPVCVQFVKEQGVQWVVHINITEAGFLSPQNSTLQSSDLKKKNPENLSHPDNTFPAEQLFAKENGKKHLYSGYKHF